LRPFGPEANHSFRSRLYDEIDVDLVELHPATNQPMPGIASEWAVSKDKRTVYFKVDPDATYSNGEKVNAEDFLTFIYVRVSNNVNNPYTKQFFKEQFANMTIYDDRILSVTVPEPVPDLIYTICKDLTASSPSFYREYGPDYKERYQWRVPPTTGAYQVTPERYCEVL